MSESQIQHYDNYAHHYVTSRRNNLCNRIYDDYWIQQMFAALPVQKGNRFLDPMCGAGELVEASLSRFKLAVGCDISASMTEFAAASRKTTLLRSDVTNLPFQDAAFDAVMIRGGLHHVHQNLSRALSEIHRVLKPGGYIVASEPIDDLRLIRWVRSIMYRFSKKFDHTEERAFVSEELLNSLRNAGLDMVSYRPFGFVAYALIGNTDVLGLLARLRSVRLIRVLIGTDSWMARTALLRHFNLACVLVAQKSPHRSVNA